MHVPRTLITVALASAAAVHATIVAVAAPPVDGNGVVASFEGNWINLARGWGDARACISDSVGTRCYRSEAELDAVEAGNAPKGVVPQASCSSPTRLYAGTGRTGTVLQLSTRQTYHALGGYGFDNVTSSYAIGACAALFYDVYPSTSLYPGGTGAGAWANAMASGWDNRVSSVFIT